MSIVMDSMSPIPHFAKRRKPLIERGEPMDISMEELIVKLEKQRYMWENIDKILDSFKEEVISRAYYEAFLKWEELPPHKAPQP